MKTSKSILFLAIASVCAAGIATADPGAKTGVTVTPSELKWEPSKRTPGLEVADIVGKGGGKDAGPYVYRVKFPPNFKMESHSHPEDRSYVIVSGTWYIGWGKKFDASKLIALPAGSFYTEPANAPHFLITKDDGAVIQISGNGPSGTKYTDPAHAPKK